MVSFFLDLRLRVIAGDGLEGLEGELSGVDCGDVQGEGVSKSDTLSRTDTLEVPGRFNRDMFFLGTRWFLGGRLEGGRHWKGARGLGKGYT